MIFHDLIYTLHVHMYIRIIIHNVQLQPASDVHVFYHSLHVYTCIDNSCYNVYIDISIVHVL